MADCIRREDALESICSDCMEHGERGTFCGIPCVEYERIMTIPAADVRPVVRGWWVHGEYGPYCSNCDGYPPTRKRSGHPGDTEFDYTRFCPNCGADMQEVQR